MRGLMAQLFSGTCGMCTACCCRADICEEAIQSAFLSKLLEKQGLTANDMDDRIGWLDLSGCSLDYGKPPICYSYYCDQLLARLPNEESRHVTQVLGKLMHHIGQHALEDWNLVEIMNPEDLKRVDLSVLSKKLEEARAAFKVIEQFMQTDRLDKADYQVLSLITTDEP